MTGAVLTSTGSFADTFKQVYEPRFREAVIQESEVWDLFQEVGGFEVSDGPDGKQINLAHVFSYGGGVGFMGESDYVYASQDPNIKQSFLNIKQATATVEMSGQTMRRAKEGSAAFLSWANIILPEKVKRLAHHKDRALLGTGSGILFQLNGTPGGATGIAINNAFGISGLEGSPYMIWEGDGLRFASDAAGSSLRVGACFTTKVSFGAQTMDVNALPASATSGDFVFLGDANVNSAGTKETMGLEGIVDDGTNVPTFQGLARATYGGMSAQIINSQTANSGAFAGVLGEDLLEFGDRVSYERGQGKCDVLLTSRSGRAVYQKDLRADRVFMDPLSGAGYIGGIKERPEMDFGSRKLQLRVARKVPTSRSYLLERSTLAMFRVGQGKWDDTTGSIWNRATDATGRRDAYYAVYLEEYNVACNRPLGNVKFTNLLPG